MRSSKTSTTLLVDLIVFVSSYFPLFFILLIKDVKLKNFNDIFVLYKNNQLILSNVFSNPSWSVSTFLVALCCFFLLFVLTSFLFSCRGAGEKIRVVEVDIVRGDMLNYTIPFLIGLIGVGYDKWQEIASFITFLSFMFIFLRKDESILLNPMLLLLNIRLYRITYYRIASRNKRLDALDAFYIGDLEASETTLTLKRIKGISLVLKKK